MSQAIYTHLLPNTVIRGEETLDEFLARCRVGCGPHEVGCECHVCAPERHTHIVWDFQHPDGRECVCTKCMDWKAWFREQEDAELAS